MTFLNENWFWAGVFPFGATIAALATSIKEWLRGRTQVKLERLRMHERELIDAYKRLYDFLANAKDTLFPPSDPRGDFIAIMKNGFLAIKSDMLLFSPEIRALLREFEGQYRCLSDPDLHPSIPFDEFISKHALKKIRRLQEIVEKGADVLLHKS